MLVEGLKAPIIGNISMDSCAIDVTEIVKLKGSDSVGVQKMVTVIGESCGENISVSQWADIDGTIPYEILTSIPERVPRQVI